jgi:hypothetical protein
MTFFRDREIYPDACEDGGSAIVKWREPASSDRLPVHRSESPTGCSSAGCSPAEPASASPAELDLKKLEVREKWKKLPLLLGQPQTFNIGASPYQTFSELITLRNDVLVHFKPGLSPSSTKQPFSALVKDIERARRYHSCIGEMVRTLNKLTGGKTSVPGFLNGARYLATITVDFPIASDVLAGEAPTSG